MHLRTRSLALMMTFDIDMLFTINYNHAPACGTINKVSMHMTLPCFTQSLPIKLFHRIANLVVSMHMTMV